MSIQYFGRGLNDTEPDRYSKFLCQTVLQMSVVSHTRTPPLVIATAAPHCDGDCTGLPHKYGTRYVATQAYGKCPIQY
jgi:hypothetical protein